MSSGTNDVEVIRVSKFRRMIANKNMMFYDHAIDHILSGQRRVHTKRNIIITLQRETPKKVYLQRNGRYNAYYIKDTFFLQIIMEINSVLRIVTFMNSKTLQTDIR